MLVRWLEFLMRFGAKSARLSHLQTSKPLSVVHWQSWHRYCKILFEAPTEYLAL